MTQTEGALLVIPNESEVKPVWKAQYDMQLAALLTIRAKEAFQHGRSSGDVVPGSETTSEGGRPQSTCSR